MMNIAPNCNIERRVSAWEKHDKCTPWCICGWFGRERNLTAENMEKARQDTWRHRKSCKRA